MTSLPSRRRLLATGASAALGLGVAAASVTPAQAGTGQASAGRVATGVAEEKRTLDELYHPSSGGICPYPTPSHQNLTGGSRIKFSH